MEDHVQVPEVEELATWSLIDLVLGATPAWSLASAAVDENGRAHLKLAPRTTGAALDAPTPVEMLVDFDGELLDCSGCLAPNQPVIGRRWTHWRYTAVLGRSVLLQCAVPILDCQACGERVVEPPWVGQPGYVQLDGVQLGGAEISPRQYRHAFADLRAALPERDASILWHYHAYGRAEIKSGHRVAEKDTLAAITFQNFSTRFWGDAPSPYFKVVLGETDTLDIVFAYTFIHEGQFQLDTVPSRNTRLFLNTRDNDFYQRGIPGVTATIEETAAWLGKIVAHLAPRTIRTHGSSMGGYAALLFGHLLGADGVYTTAPQVRLGNPYCRSWEWNRARVYHARWRDLTPVLASMIDRTRILFPVGEIFEYDHVAAFEAAGLDKLYFVQGGHPGMKQMDWEKVFGADWAIGLEDGAANTPRYAFRYGPGEVAQINLAYGAIRRGEHSLAVSILRDIVAFDWGNYGFRYRLGVHETLMGDLASGLDHLAPALAAIWKTETEPDMAAKQAQWLKMLDLDYGHILPASELQILTDLFPMIWQAIGSEGQRGSL